MIFMNAFSPFSNSGWIRSNIEENENSSAQAPLFRKTFNLDVYPISASLAITAFGLYDCRINGVPVGDQLLSPGWTDYRVKCHYQTFQVSNLLNLGENVISVILGDGWFCGHIGWIDRQNYGNFPSFIAQLDILDQSGLHIVSTDETWKTVSGHILENDLIMGETCDARMQPQGWACPGFDDAAWFDAKSEGAIDIRFEISPAPPIRRIAEIPPLTCRASGSSSRLYDFGQNFSGRVRIEVEAPCGTEVVLRFGETVNEDGSLYTENLRRARVTDRYICAGTGVEMWEPMFTFHGFRYVEAAGLGPDTRFGILGIVMHSDMEMTGHFSCSNPLLNQLQSNIVWSQRSNFLDVPTDCPQRDERLGWTGDAQVFLRTACFNMNVHGFFKKWLSDIRDAQCPDGGIPCVAPTIPHMTESPFYDGGAGWSDAIIICPWTIYQYYGDIEVLKENYDSMKRYMSFLDIRWDLDGKRLANTDRFWGGYGDWLALDGSDCLQGGTSHELIALAFYAYDCDLMVKSSTAIGNVEDSNKFLSLGNKVRAEFCNRFVLSDGTLLSNTQTANVLALNFRMVPEELRERLVSELVNDIELRDFHLSTGFVGTPYLLDVLEESGQIGVAYKLIEQETFPSWLFPIKNGATTIWERWDGWTVEGGMQDKGMNSFNHYAYGAVGSWMYRIIAGIDFDEKVPGCRSVIFRPRPGGSLTFAKGSLITLFGTLAIEWNLIGDCLQIQITVPIEMTAVFVSPSGFSTNERVFGVGSYSFEVSRAQRFASNDERVLIDSYCLDA